MNDVDIELVGPITQVERIARGREIRVLWQLVRRHGPGRWRKLKGIAPVRFPDGRIARAEVHFYEAHGIGRRGLKVKRVLD